MTIYYIILDKNYYLITSSWEKDVRYCVKDSKHLKNIYLQYLSKIKSVCSLETMAKVAFFNSLWIIKDGEKVLECLSPMHVKYL